MANPARPTRVARRRLTSSWSLPLLLACLLGAPALRAQAATSSDDGPAINTTDVSRVRMIGNDDIIKMAKAGLGDDLLVQTINSKPGHYDTAPDDLIALKTAGISDRVISTMEAHGTGLTLRPSRTLASSTSLTAGALPAGVDEIGVYYKSSKSSDAGQWLPLQTERVVFKSGGAAKSILTHGIISKDMNGHLNGPKSDLSIPTGVEILIYAPLGTDANEYDFLRLQEHKDNREFRTLTGGVFHSESGAERNELEFHPKKIAAQMYTFTVPVDIEKGEYGVLPPGSANTQGIAGTGKIFTFAIRE